MRRIIQTSIFLILFASAAIAAIVLQPISGMNNDIPSLKRQVDFNFNQVRYAIDSQIPSQRGNSGKYLTTNGTSTAWAVGGGGGGTSDHALLSNLSYASSGHTGFQPAGSYLTSITADSPLSGAGTSASHLTIDLSNYDTIAARNTALSTFELSSHASSAYIPYIGATANVNTGNYGVSNLYGGIGTFTNYATYSENVNSWSTKSNVVVTDNDTTYTNPMGGTTGVSKIVFTGSGGYNDAAVQRNIVMTVGSKTWTHSFWAKCAAGTQVLSIKTTQAGVADHWQDFTITTTWTRYIYTVTFAAGGTGFWTGYGNGAAGASSTAYVFGDQIEEASTAGIYVKVPDTTPVSSSGITTPANLQVSGMSVGKFLVGNQATTDMDITGTSPVSLIKATNASGKPTRSMYANNESTGVYEEVDQDTGGSKYRMYNYNKHTAAYKQVWNIENSSTTGHFWRYTMNGYTGYTGQYTQTLLDLTAPYIGFVRCDSTTPNGWFLAGAGNLETNIANSVYWGSGFQFFNGSIRMYAGTPNTNPNLLTVAMNLGADGNLTIGNGTTSLGKMLGVNGAVRFASIEGSAGGSITGTLEVKGGVKIGTSETIANISTGVYTPTYSAVGGGNVASCSTYQGRWTRIGKTVQVNFRAYIDPTSANTDSYADFSLPIPSAFTSATDDLSGNLSAGDSAGIGSGYFYAETAGGNARCEFTSTTTGGQYYGCQFSYLIK